MSETNSNIDVGDGTACPAVKTGWLGTDKCMQIPSLFWSVASMPGTDLPHVTGSPAAFPELLQYPRHYPRFTRRALSEGDGLPPPSQEDELLLERPLPCAVDHAKSNSGRKIESLSEGSSPMNHELDLDIRMITQYYPGVSRIRKILGSVGQPEEPGEDPETTVCTVRMPPQVPGGSAGFCDDNNEVNVGIASWQDAAPG